MKKPSCLIILFSIHFVLKAEKLLLADNISIDVIPVPRDLSSDCGMAIKFSYDDIERVQGVLVGGRIAIAQMFKQEKENGFVELYNSDE